MAMANEIKVIVFGSKKVERRITLNLVRKVTGGMEAAGDVFNEKGEKTGFYRYKSQFEYPVFFSKKGKRFYGDNPINKAIKEVVHSWAASINAKRKEAVIQEAIKKEVKKASKPSLMPEKVDINEAEADILASLPGISLPIAGRIIEYRENEGGFQSTEDLMKIKGIGQAKYEKLKEMIRV